MIGVNNLPKISTNQYFSDAITLLMKVSTDVKTITSDYSSSYSPFCPFMVKMQVIIVNINNILFILKYLYE